MTAPTGSTFLDASPAPRGTVFAAGGVLWRHVDGDLRVLLVHRTKYRDWSFPKGKVDPGESLPETAVRELAEETGVRGVLGPSLGTVQYGMPSGRDKIVHYWAVEATADAVRASTFRPNREIAGLAWLTTAEAREKLDYPADVEILDEFEALVRDGGLGTFPIVLMRHGQAVSPSSFSGPDAARTLTPRGERQARGAVGPVRAFGVRKVFSSTARRCVQTVTPLADALGKRIREKTSLSQDAWEDGSGDVQKLVGKRVAKGKPCVICSHGPVLPRVMDALAVATGTVRSHELSAGARLQTGAFTVVHVRRGSPGAGIVAVETHAPRA